MNFESAADLDAMFDDSAGFAEVATYRAGGAGSGVVVSVMLFQADRELQPFSRAIVSGGTRLTVQAAEVASPAAGDTFTVDGTVYTVQGEPVRDATRKLWNLEARG